MSLHLGKIHYWLFNKIKLFELSEKNILDWAEKNNLPVGQWKDEIYKEYGGPLEDKPLEEMIDTGNIHGWLQDKIERAERRYATLVTKILEIDNNYMDNLLNIMKEKGDREGKEFTGDKNSLEAIYNVINDYVVEGMPCDRINVLVSSDVNELIWESTRCLHKKYWDFDGGNVDNFYSLREMWIKAFVGAINPELHYEKLEEGTHKISR